MPSGRRGWQEHLLLMSGMHVKTRDMFEVKWRLCQQFQLQHGK